jgi:hypothetical protein
MSSRTHDCDLENPGRPTWAREPGHRGFTEAIGAEPKRRSVSTYPARRRHEKACEEFPVWQVACSFDGLLARAGSP